ncbi:MAG: PDZ domain-containing protein [Gemmataceae bacterium]|nr:PDZ domain-containing protein [Gemmataceae bacterium]
MLSTLCVLSLLAADPPKWEVPYKTTIPKHIVVRLKINGKGPFNFILDTGAPALFIAEKVGKKAGLANGKDGWATMDKLQVEGGPTLLGAKGRVETPFQLEGMNGLGMAGMEIHGMLGYSILAAYRMEIDFTRDKMTWTEIGKPAELPRRGGKGGAAGGLEMMGTLMKGLGTALGRKATPDLTLRGFFGMTIQNGDEHPVVAAVLIDGPAGKAGLRKDDIILKVGGRGVYDTKDVLLHAGKATAGKEVELTIKRGGEEKTIAFKAGEGI